MSADDFEEAVQTIAKIHSMLVCAIAEGSELKIVYSFIRPATARDLAKLETSISWLVRGVLRHDFKLKPRQIPKFFLDLQKGTWKDDGDNTVTVTLDFGKLLPGERASTRGARLTTYATCATMRTLRLLQ